MYTMWWKTAAVPAATAAVTAMARSPPSLAEAYAKAQLPTHTSKRGEQETEDIHQQAENMLQRNGVASTYLRKLRAALIAGGTPAFQP